MSKVTNISLDHLGRCLGLEILDVRNVRQISLVGLSKFVGGTRGGVSVRHSLPPADLAAALRASFYQSEMVASRNSLTSPHAHAPSFANQPSPLLLLPSSAVQQHQLSVPPTTHPASLVVSILP
jgi:hypothetical protein